MQLQQQERLKRMINNSSMLTAKEKEEWLDMLIVMNDKQVSELEAILSSPMEKPVVPPAPVRSVAPTPPLSHISNLPSSMTQPQTAAPVPPRYPLPVPPNRPTLKQWEIKLRREVEEKELPKPAEQKSLPAYTIPNPAKSPVPIVYPKPALKPLTPTPPRPSQPPQQPAKNETVAKRAPIKIVEPKDIGLINVETMRAMGENLAPTLKQMVASSNYFEVLFYLEKSSLYQAYLQTGREALSGNATTFNAAAGGKNLLTKAEFEAFSDLLKSIQIS